MAGNGETGTKTAEEGRRSSKQITTASGRTKSGLVKSKSLKKRRHLLESAANQINQNVIDQLFRL
jgi:hypothetical protein